MFMGSSVHAKLDHGHAHDEQKLFMDLAVPILLPDGTGMVVTLALGGTLDHYDAEHRRLVDYKTTSKEFFEMRGGKRKKRELPEPGHVLQTNIYRLLLEENGYPVEDIRIWYVRMVPRAPRELVTVPLWDLEEVYLTAVELAKPLALARETGELPPCACRYHDLDPDLCQTVTDWDPSLVREPPLRRVA